MFTYKNKNKKCSVQDHGDGTWKKMGKNLGGLEEFSNSHPFPPHFISTTILDSINTDNHPSKKKKKKSKKNNKNK